MQKKLQTSFSTRQYMLSKDYELYYYNDSTLNMVDRHTHDYYEFYFFLEGNVSIEIGKDIYRITPGDIIIIPPAVSHRPIIHNVDVPYRRFVFWISRDFCNHLLNLSSDYGYIMQLVETKKTYLFHNDRITFNAIQSKLLLLLEEMHGNRFGKRPQLSLYVSDLVLHLNRLVYEKEHPSAPGEIQALYRKICSFIESHLDEDLSLDRLAGEFFVSKYHIAHIFKENLGLSIHQYITKKRLAHCRQSITGGMNITEAYHSFGFGDYSSFYRAFKKEYGISPKDYVASTQNSEMLKQNPEEQPTH
ncbi:MAG: helix-turn-helix domain-containing protein [Lachnospiraceae bacterium]|nr:helix-turn-helix domain-containing protein [Lachnospiraceae bacterium]